LEKIPEVAKGGNQESEESLSQYERLLRIVQISPRAAIMEAWRDIEFTTKMVTDAYGISVGGNIAGERAIRDLTHKGILPDSVCSVQENEKASWKGGSFT